MSKKNIIILVVAIAFFGVALVIYGFAKNEVEKDNQMNNSSSQSTNTIVSEKDEKNGFFDADGKEYSLDDFSDKPMVVLLWRSDSSKSYAMIELMEKYYDQYKNQINFLAINVNDSDTDLDLKEHIKAANFTIPIYYDTNQKMKEEFAYEKLPDMLFLSKDQNIEKETLEEITEDSFTANLDLLAGNY